MEVYRFRLIDIINNYRHYVVLPNEDLDGKAVKNKIKILEKLKKGEFKIIYVTS